MYPSHPALPNAKDQEKIMHERAFAYTSPHLLVYTLAHVDVFNVHSGEWVQTLCLRHASPLTPDGLITMTSLNEQPLMVLLADVTADEDAINTGYTTLTARVDPYAAPVSMRSKRRHFLLKSGAEVKAE